jgi:predicted Rossmann fold nucleotide-binding protein DprA/Smf involved in DNA uptake
LNNNDFAYWITVSQLPRWKTKRINDLIIKIIHEKKLSWTDFFALEKSDYIHDFDLNDNETNDLLNAKKEIPNNSFLAESLIAQGYELISINSPDYSKTLKENLKISSPPLLYVKGNKKLLNEDSIAVVGSRDASDVALKFTDNIAKIFSKQYKVIISGFAKGVDKQALDSAIKYTGHSIIVLPQGILTFSFGFKKYYTQIIEGNVLVLSIFHPKAVWNTGLAMARNPIIYGLAKNIYVAQSNDSGGTWAGVNDGLRKNRIIYVRYPGIDEKCANKLLIEKGAFPVDFNGEILEQHSAVKDNEPELIRMDNSYKEKILDIIKLDELTSKQIIDKLDLNIHPKELDILLQKDEDFEIACKRPYKYKARTQIALNLSFAQ